MQYDRYDYLEEGFMGFLAYLNQIAADSLSGNAGFQACPMYIFLNLAVPLTGGIFLGGCMKIAEKMLGRKKGRRD